jgi:hypothetical protein
VYQQQGIGLEQRLSELQAQIDQLNLALHLWRQKEDQFQPAERRLAQLTDRCAQILEQWSTAGERHAQTLGQIESRLSGLTALETRVQHDASERIHDLERSIEHEWTSLRHLHEEPVRQLREQAASLAEVCVAAATSAQRGFERAEARLAVLETDLQQRMAELSRDLRAAVAELRPRGDRPPALSDGASSWPLEGVMRLHSQLRESDDVSGGAVVDTAAVVAAAVDADVQRHTGAADAPTQPPEPAAAAAPAIDTTKVLADRMNSLEQALNDGQAEIRAATERTDRLRRTWRVAGAVLAVGAVAAATIAWRSQRDASAAAARVVQAEQQVRTERDTAAREVTAARDDASQQIAAARDAAERAQTISDVLAAPDMIRFNLAGGTAEGRFSAQLLWSRSRGLVFSGSRLPAPPQGSAYQIWLATNGAPVSAGVFVPDESGRATVATDKPPRVPRPVIDILVTTESSGGAPAPSGPTLLARAVPRPPAP